MAFVSLAAWGGDATLTVGWGTPAGPSQTAPVELTGAPASALCGVRTPDGAPAVALSAAPGQSAQADSAPLTFTARHLYRFQCPLRRDPRSSFQVWLIGPPPENSPWWLMPPGDFLVAPVWETITGFWIAPEGPAVSAALRFRLQNQPDGLAPATAGFGQMTITDAGAPVPLAPPRPVLSWDRIELTDQLLALPRVPSSGAGVYRARCHLTADRPVEVQLLLAQGDDPVLHWHRTSEYLVVLTVPAGESDQEAVYSVPDRRFAHQWVRVRCSQAGQTATLTRLEVEQVLREPDGAAALGLQTPKYR
jgi:hypothetical protein